MSEAFDMLAEAVGIEPLQRRENTRVQCSPTVLKDPAVGDLVGQSVLERVFEVGEETGLIEGFCGLQPRETLSQLIFGVLGNRLKEIEGYVLADNSSSLEYPLVLRQEAVDACREDRLHGCRHPNRMVLHRQTVRAAAADQRPGFHQSPDTLLQEERIAFGVLDQRPFNCSDAWVGTDHVAEEVVSALG
jgi:hypothetical protein